MKLWAALSTSSAGRGAQRPVPNLKIACLCLDGEKVAIVVMSWQVQWSRQRRSIR